MRDNNEHTNNKARDSVNGFITNNSRMFKSSKKLKVFIAHIQSQYLQIA